MLFAMLVNILHNSIVQAETIGLMRMQLGMCRLFTLTCTFPSGRGLAATLI